MSLTYDKEMSATSISSTVTEKVQNISVPTLLPDEAAAKKTEVTDSAYHDPELGVNKQPSTQDDDQVDGGYGWLVILGTFMVQVTCFGVASCWGILQDHLDVTRFRDTVPNSQFQLSFVGTILEVCVNLMGPVAQIIASRFGSKSVMILGTILMTVGMELASISSQIWHFYLTQGVLFGSGASFLYVTAMSTATLWFNKKRGFALGLASGGSGIGGLVVPFIITAINENLGIEWSFRILGFICLFSNIIACICVKDKESAKKKKGERSLSAIFDFSVMKDTNFLLWTCASVISLMGYFVPYFFLPAYATYLNLSRSEGSSLIAIMSASSFIGRLLVGFIGDRIGRLNADIIWTLCCAVSTLLCWTFAYSFPVLIVYAVLFGIFSPSYFAMMTPITASILNSAQYKTGVSTLMLFNIISIFGISIASAIETGANAEPYMTYKMFTGVTYLVGGLLLIVLKIKITGRLLAKF